MQRQDVSTIIKVCREERWLMEIFQEFDAYRKGVRRLIPFSKILMMPLYYCNYSIF